MEPRSIGFAELIDILEKEHVGFNGRMHEIQRKIKAGDYRGAFAELSAMKESLYQHIVDEESSVLTLLIDRLGREGASEAIETFQEHVDIQDMIEELEGLLNSANSSTEQLGARLDAFMIPPGADTTDLRVVKI